VNCGAHGINESAPRDAGLSFLILERSSPCQSTFGISMKCCCAFDVRTFATI
jgi:hypothetical protein